MGSSRTTDNRAAGCFKLRVGSAGCILACTWDRVKQERKVLRARAHTAGSTYKPGCNLDIQTLR